MSAYQILLVIHVACIAAWFGGTISLPGRLRRGMAAGDSEFKFIAGEIARGYRLSMLFAILSMVTGLLLVFKRGGFAHVAVPIHMGLGFTLVMVGLEIFINRSASSRISEILAKNEDRSLIQPLKTRLVISSGIGQLLWLIVLVLMISQRGVIE